MSQFNVKSPKNAKSRKNKTEIGSLTGLCKVYRHSVAKFTDMAAPINQWIWENKLDSFELDEYQLANFQNVIEMVCAPPKLALYHPQIPYAIDTDVNNCGIGVALFQTHADTAHKPLFFFSLDHFTRPKRTALHWNENVLP